MGRRVGDHLTHVYLLRGTGEITVSLARNHCPSRFPRNTPKTFLELETLTPYWIDRNAWQLLNHSTKPRRFLQDENLVLELWTLERTKFVVFPLSLFFFFFFLSETETERQRPRDRHRQRDRPTDRGRETQTDRQIVRPTDRPTDRQTDRQTERCQ